MAEIRWLDQLTRNDVSTAGGKGANLGELVRAGFPVPDGFVVTTHAYADFVATHQLGDAIRRAPSTETQVGELFAAGELPDELVEEIGAAYARLGERTPVAVRSSATAEDLAEASFAGQQDTFLNVVGLDALLTAIRACWASLWTDRAIHYRAGHGVDQEGLALAVVVQRLVPADAAGVMFTANPTNGRTEETVITAAWGLGEAVVSGMVDTDTVVVDTDSGRILTRVVADKAVRIDPVLPGDPAGDPAGDRTRTSDTDQAQRRSAVLDDADALRLAGIGRAIERQFGQPQDIEWVLADGEFSIVQARPITALPPRIGPLPTEWPVPQKGLYFRASIIEQLPEPLSPLFADLTATAVPEGLNRLLSELSASGSSASGSSASDSPRSDGYDVGFPTINGYAFYRYSYRAFGGMLRHAPELVRMVTAEGGRRIEDRWRDRLAHYVERVAELGAENAEGNAAAGNPGEDAPDVPAAALLERIAALVDEMAYYYTSVQTIIPVASMAELIWTGVYDKLLKRPGDPAAEEFLLGYDSEPIRAEKSLAALAAWVREQPELAAAVGDDAVDALAEAAPSGVQQAPWDQWRQRFRDHLDAHGHTLYNLDFVNPVPADAPEPTLQALRFFLTGAAVDPVVRQSRLAARREAVAAALMMRLSGRRQGLVRGLLAQAQHTGPLREDALSAMGLYLPGVRRLLRELGRRLVAAGALEEPMDVCWVTLPEAKEAAARLDSGQAVDDLRSRVGERRVAARGQGMAEPPQYLPRNAAMDAFGWMYPAREGQVGSVLVGNAGSGGVVTATARVLAGPQDFADFRPGEVLVASITTPAYTPLFAMAAGVVTDIGGVLSHGSIVAREYGIPAVLGTGSATRVIHTGDEITVDGAAGRVHLPDVSGVLSGVLSDVLSDVPSDGAGEPPEPDRKRRLAAVAAVALAAATVAHIWYWGYWRRDGRRDGRRSRAIG